MPSTITKPISARVPNDQVVAFREQAERSGLTVSRALATLVAGALAGDEPTAKADESGSET